MERSLTLPDFFSDICTKYPHRTAFVERKKYRRQVWTYQKVQTTVEKFNELLAQKSLTKGDAVILCLPNSPYWSCLFFACAQRGIVVSPLDTNSSTDFIQKIALLTEAKFIFFSRYLPQARVAYSSNPLFIEDLVQEIESLPRARGSRNTQVTPQDTLEIVFSSGSTGNPKGIVLTHENVCANLYSLAEAVPIDQDRKFLSIIPLSHMFEQTVGLLSPLLRGASITYLSSIKPRSIIQALKEEQITSIVCVPAFLQLLKNSSLRQLEQLGRLASFTRLMTLVAHAPQSVRKLASTQLRQGLGSSLRELYVGGAALDRSLEAFWSNLGIDILQGYGMTEASPIIASNSHAVQRRGSVGKVLPIETVKLAEDGEILVKGPNVTHGYYKNPEADNAGFEKGWLKTGDIGELDEEGFLFIRGRKKNTIIGPSGMKIYPEDLEQALREYAHVKDAIVFGREKNAGMEVSAVVLLSDRKRASRDILELANAHLASHQQIDTLCIWPDEDFPRTPTRKIIRQAVLDRLTDVEGSVVCDTAPAANEGSVTPLIKIIVEVTGVSTSDIAPSSKLMTDLRLDSIKRLELASRIEDELNIELDEASITQHSTVAVLEKLITTTHEIQKTQALPRWPSSPFVSQFRLLLQSFLFIYLRSFQTIKVTGKSNLRVTQPVILIANHQSHLDAPDIVKCLPRSMRRRVCVAAAKDYFFGNRVTAFWTQLLLHTFPLDREGNVRESLRTIGKLLDEDSSVLIFPEGTRTTNGKMAPFKQGIGIIAQEMGVPIVPIHISGNFEILPKGQSKPTRGTTKITIGKPITVPTNGSSLEVTKMLQDAVERL